MDSKVTATMPCSDRASSMGWRVFQLPEGSSSSSISATSFLVESHGFGPFLVYTKPPDRMKVPPKIPPAEKNLNKVI